MHSQNGLVDDAMTYSHHPLAWVGGCNIYKECTRTRQQVLFTLYVVRPYLAAQVRNEAPRERAPVALAQQRGGMNRQAMGVGNDLSRLNSTVQVAAHDGIDRLRRQSLGYLQSLLPTLLVQLSLSLPLHNLPGIVDGLSVSY